MNNNFLFKYTIRDLFAKKSYSLYFIYSVLLGVGSVAGIHSYKENLTSMIHKESKSLMGGDLLLESPVKLKKETFEFLKKNLPEGSLIAISVNFASMLYRKDNNNTTLSTIKALGSNYPFYEKIQTTPENAFQKLGNHELLMNEDIAQKLEISIGDDIYLGNSKFILKGYIEKEPGMVSNFMGMAPTTIIRLDNLKSTGLQSRGSRIRYNVLVKLPEGIDARKFKDDNFPNFIKNDLTIYHHAEVGSGSQRFINNTFDYMSLLALAAFFLGSISILISCRTRINEKEKEFSILKCLGADIYTIGKLFIAEIILLSFIGSSIGILTGYYFQFLIPDFTSSEFLKTIHPSITPGALIRGLAIGIIIPLVVSLESIIKLIGISPLGAIRKGIEEKAKIRLLPEPIFLIEIIIIYLSFYALSVLETDSYFKGMILSGVLVALPLILFFLYYFLRFFSKLFLKTKFGSPDFKLVLKKINQTGSGLSLPIIGIGSGISILLISLVMQNSLITLSGADYKEKRANMFILDIKENQKEKYDQIINKYPVLEKYDMPVIGARLLSINNEEVKKENTEKDALKRDWRATARSREYFLSYRKELYKTESVVDGNFWENSPDPQISIEYDLSKILGVKTGDILAFNVQGIIINGRISNTRTVNWSDLKPNVVVLFSPGILDNAPKYYISSFYLEKNSDRKLFQKDLISEIPNATVIDVEKTIKGFNEIINKVSGVIKLMTIFIISCSILALLTSLYSTRNLRQEETSFFRVLGANSRFIRRMYFFEGSIVAFYSFLSSLLLVLPANFIISEYYLNLKYHIPILEFAFVFLCLLIINLGIYYFQVNGIMKNSAYRTLKGN